MRHKRLYQAPPGRTLSSMKTPALLLAALLLAGCTGPAVVAQVPATSTSAAPAPAATEADDDSTVKDFSPSSLRGPTS